MGKLRMVLLGLVLFSAVTSASGAGTFASFNASTENAGTFDSGVLVLSTQKQAGTLCYSYGTLDGNGSFSNGNANPSCTDTVVPVSTLRIPSATELTFNVILRNEGDVTASFIKFYVPSCTTANDAGSVHGPPTTVPGDSGDICGSLLIAVQETTSSFATPSTPSTGCRYPTVSPSAPCATPTTSMFTAKGAIGTVATATQLQHLITMPPSNGVANCTSVPAACRYYQVRLLLPTGASGAENNLMGKVASFQLGWLLEQ